MVDDKEMRNPGCDYHYFKDGAPGLDPDPICLTKNYLTCDKAYKDVGYLKPGDTVKIMNNFHVPCENQVEHLFIIRRIRLEDWNTLNNVVPHGVCDATSQKCVALTNGNREVPWEEVTVKAYEYYQYPVEDPAWPQYYYLRDCSHFVNDYHAPGDCNSGNYPTKNCDFLSTAGRYEKHNMTACFNSIDNNNFNIKSYDGKRCGTIMVDEDEPCTLTYTTPTQGNCADNSYECETWVYCATSYIYYRNFLVNISNVIWITKPQHYLTVNTYDIECNKINSTFRINGVQHNTNEQCFSVNPGSVTISNVKANGSCDSKIQQFTNNCSKSDGCNQDAYSNSIIIIIPEKPCHYTVNFATIPNLDGLDIEFISSGGDQSCPGRGNRMWSRYRLTGMSLINCNWNRINLMFVINHTRWTEQLTIGHGISEIDEDGEFRCDWEIDCCCGNWNSALYVSICDNCNTNAIGYSLGGGGCNDGECYSCGPGKRCDCLDPNCWGHCADGGACDGYSPHCPGTGPPDPVYVDVTINVYLNNLTNSTCVNFNGTAVLDGKMNINIINGKINTRLPIGTHTISNVRESGTGDLKIDGSHCSGIESTGTSFTFNVV